MGQLKPIIPVFRHSMIGGGRYEEAQKNESLKGSLEEEEC